MTKEEVFEYIEKARSMGLKSIEVNGIKVEFQSKIVREVKANTESIGDDMKAEDLVMPPNPYDVLTDEEILFWSSDRGIELEMERRKEQLDAIKRTEDFKE